MYQGNYIPTRPKKNVCLALVCHLFWSTNSPHYVHLKMDFYHNSDELEVVYHTRIHYQKY